MRIILVHSLCTYVNNVNALGNGNQHVNKLNDFNILYANADSLPNNLDELKSRLQDSDRSIDIIGITEVFPKNCRYNPGKAELQIDGYDLFIVELKEFLCIFIPRSCPLFPISFRIVEIRHNQDM
jgi:hypothetical protein